MPSRAESRQNNTRRTNIRYDENYETLLTNDEFHRRRSTSFPTNFT